ncbi:DNA repair exonuclease SbcCD nuclease subunit [Amphibacillus marinus]|uniref:DNA repair exonuclease SbcCD nuclease subunit n=1 Tax=Amphibacillus marinus TaxID=872970 RepID=A0A1H8ILJ1_9BACI|nr:DNA repair exonuclease [Amphibacillus marinus]SEN68598.1 DNA repair exonuclease SbcCD nuclease subunit [Amphibacillus marinus]
MDYSFIHVADIHLDSPLKGLEKYEGAPVDQIRLATREAFKALVGLAIEKRVAFILISGDLYDGDWKDYNTGLFFINQMLRLKSAAIDVYLIRGNHDAQNVMTKALVLPSNVYEFPVDLPQTVINEDLKVAIHGQGFETRAVTKNLAVEYPNPVTDYFNIGILHTSLTGREDHEHYAPCSLDELIAKGYHYWALGHVHQREIVHEQEPVVLFPGNIQGRHIREQGEKGCTIVEVIGGQVSSYYHRSLDVLRWTTCKIDLAEVTDMDEVIHLAREHIEHLRLPLDGRLLAVRLHFVGASQIHQRLIVEKTHLINQLRSLSLEFGDVWIEKVEIKTTRWTALEELAESHTPIAVILEYIRSITANEDEQQALLAEFKDIANALPYELKNKSDQFNFNSTKLIAARLTDAEELILNAIQMQEGS